MILKFFRSDLMELVLNGFILIIRNDIPGRLKVGYKIVGLKTLRVFKGYLFLRAKIPMTFKG